MTNQPERRRNPRRMSYEKGELILIGVVCVLIVVAVVVVGLR